MQYMAIAETDIGITRATNQDSVLIKHGKLENGKEILMVIVCDGMGGLSNGEVASATVIKSFAKWFEHNLPMQINVVNIQVIANNWSLMLKELNMKIQNYSNNINVKGMGTTFTGMLIIGDEYTIVHVGDSRVYKNTSKVQQLTKDQTFIEREIQRGTITREQAKNDKRRNMLLQCVGASKVIEPEILYGNMEKGVYLLCSDGFRHEINDDEILEQLNFKALKNKETMHNNTKKLIELVKTRGERDNISAIVIKSI